MSAFLSCRGWGEDGWGVVDVDVQMSIREMWACMGSWMSFATCSTYSYSTNVMLFTRIAFVGVYYLLSHASFARWIIPKSFHEFMS